MNRKISGVYTSISEIQGRPSTHPAGQARRILLNSWVNPLYEDLNRLEVKTKNALPFKRWTLGMEVWVMRARRFGLPCINGEDAYVETKASMNLKTFDAG